MEERRDRARRVSFGVCHVLEIRFHKKGERISEEFLRDEKEERIIVFEFSDLPRYIFVEQSDMLKICARIYIYIYT